MSAIDATGAQRVFVTHGYREQVVRMLRGRGLDAASLASQWEGESDEEAEADAVPDDETPPQ